MTEAVRLTQELVKIESTNPGTGEENIVDYISRYLSGCGAKVTLNAVAEGRCNVIAELKTEGVYSTSENNDIAGALILICHMDTVVIEGDWSVDPFGGEIRNGKIYGRGSCDMKSGLACALSVFHETAVKIQKGEIHLRRPLKLICTVDEEGDMRGVERIIECGHAGEKDWIVDLEPTEGQIQMAHKGRFWLTVTVHGVTAHASRPEQGADAIAAMGEIISRIRKLFDTMPVHEELGRANVTFGQIRGGYQPYVVPDECTIWLDMRLVPPMNAESVLSLINGILKETEYAIPGIQTEYVITGNRPYIEKNEKSELMKHLKQACYEVTGAEVLTGPFSGYTDTAVIAGRLGNRECMSYGPGSLNQAHKPDEYVEIEDIERCEQVYTRLIKNVVFQ